MSLSPEVIQTVKSTAPLLKEKACDITTKFYGIMFSHFPEVRAMFNFANQQPRSDFTTHGQSVGRQAQALAAAVYAFAENVDNLGVLADAVERIAHKHASLHVLPEHYPIVGTCLLRAIREVTNAPDAVIDAWADAYGLLAEILINRENALRKENEEKEGGWSGFRDFYVERKELETNDVVSLYLKPKTGTIPPYKPGQFLSFRQAVEGSAWGLQTRNYTISDAPGRGYLRVTVKREIGPNQRPHGVISTHIHDGIAKGSELQVGPPYGQFFLSDEVQKKQTPLVFCSLGIGITPTVSMVNALLDKQLHDRPMFLLHGTRNGCTHVMKNWTDELRTRPNFKVYVSYSRPTVRDALGKDFEKEGRIDIDDVKQLGATPDADFYFTGTLLFMRNLRDSLREWGVPAENIHYETFGPDVID